MSVEGEGFEIRRQANLERKRIRELEESDAKGGHSEKEARDASCGQGRTASKVGLEIIYFLISLFVFICNSHGRELFSS